MKVLRRHRKKMRGWEVAYAEKMGLRKKFNFHLKLLLACAIFRTLSPVGSLADGLRSRQNCYVMSFSRLDFLFILMRFFFPFSFFFSPYNVYEWAHDDVELRGNEIVLRKNMKLSPALQFFWLLLLLLSSIFDLIYIESRTLDVFKRDWSSGPLRFVMYEMRFQFNLLC